jgi:hypothetical protein
MSAIAMAAIAALRHTKFEKFFMEYPRSFLKRLPAALALTLTPFAAPANPVAHKGYATAMPEQADRLRFPGA